MAFLQGYNFDSTLEVQYVGHRPYPGAEIDVWEYSGPIYGDEAAPMNLHDTFTDFMTGKMEYKKMTEEQIKKIYGKETLNYVQASNELALYYHKDTGHVVAKWVDDVITRGDREVTKKFWKKMEERWKIKSWCFSKIRGMADSTTYLCPAQASMPRPISITFNYKCTTATLNA